MLRYHKMSFHCRVDVSVNDILWHAIYIKTGLCVKIHKHCYIFKLFKLDDFLWMLHSNFNIFLIYIILYNQMLKLYYYYVWRTRLITDMTCILYCPVFNRICKSMWSINLKSVPVVQTGLCLWQGEYVTSIV